MRTYKAIEKPSKFFGLTIEDAVLIGLIVGIYILVSSLLIEVGVPIKPLWSRLFLALIVFLVYKMLSWANKNKSQNFLLSWISFHYLQIKKLEPTCHYYIRLEKKPKSLLSKLDLGL